MDENKKIIRTYVRETTIARLGAKCTGVTIGQQGRQPGTKGVEEEGEDKRIAGGREEEEEEGLGNRRKEKTDIGWMGKQCTASAAFGTLTPDEFASLCFALLK